MPIAKGLAPASRSRGDKRVTRLQAPAMLSASSNAPMMDAVIDRPGAHHHMMIDQLEALIATLPALLA